MTAPEVTSETITDEQLQALKRSPRTYGVSSQNEIRVVADCRLALFPMSGGYAPKHERAAMERDQRAARARCVEIWNAWRGGES